MAGLKKFLRRLFGPRDGVKGTSTVQDPASPAEVLTQVPTEALAQVATQPQVSSRPSAPNLINATVYLAPPTVSTTPAVSLANIVPTIAASSSNIAVSTVILAPLALFGTAPSATIAPATIVSTTIAPAIGPPAPLTLETLPICNLDTGTVAFLRLPIREQDRLENFRYHVSNNESYEPGGFPARIIICDSAKSSEQRARWEERQSYYAKVLVYWTDGGFRPTVPQNAASGIVTRTPTGDYEATSISPNMDNTSGSEDAELHALIYALKHGLLEANARFQNGIYVYKIVVYLDPMFLLIHLKEIYYRTGLSNNLRELYHVARLIEKAGIELELCWVSKRGKIRPHVIADEVVVEHQNLARDQARRNLSGQEYRDLQVIPGIPNRYLVYRHQGQKRPWDNDTDSEDESNDGYGNDHNGGDDNEGSEPPQKRSCKI